MASALENALGAWRELLGAEHVFTDEERLRRAETATFATESRVLAVIRPASRDEVREALRIATRSAVPVYPVSGGKNWGLGSRVPPRDAVLLDLGRLNRILEFDEALAWVSVEPGVTFRQLHEFLRARGSRLFVSTTGGSPDGSVLANALERGDGSGPNGDRASHLAALEVVLATGEVVHTGFDRFPEPNAVAPLHRFGVGPALDGLFTQSNLGVVTRGTVWLSPLPHYLAAIRFALSDTARLAPVVEAVRALCLDGTLRSAVAFWNDLRVFSSESQYPFERAGGVTPLPAEIAREIRERTGGFAWHGLASIYAPSEEQGRAHVAHVERALRPLTDAFFVEARAGEPRADSPLFADGDPAFDFLQGIPHVESLRSVYFRKRGEPPKNPDPDRDRAGVIWLCPTLPLRAEDLARALAIAERRLAEHGFDPLFAVVSQTPRTAFFLPMIVYDRDEPGADARARACHDALFAELVGAGYLPHRLGLPAMNALPPARDDWTALVARIRHALDPAGVLAPGRYQG
jgi:4-cresol dehydrogenase (hydroxylating) flavoprotein subunit